MPISLTWNNRWVDGNDGKQRLLWFFVWSKWLGIIGDEARDEGSAEKFALLLLLIDSEYTVYVSNGCNAATLVLALRESCRRMAVSLDPAIAMAKHIYDGAFSMACYLNGYWIFLNFDVFNNDGSLLTTGS